LAAPQPVHRMITLRVSFIGLLTLFFNFLEHHPAARRSAGAMDINGGQAFSGYPVMVLL
jgi:hypothetical protein